MAYAIMELVRRLSAVGPLALFLFAAAQPQFLQAQYQKFEGMTIANIQFQPKDQPLEAGELHDLLPVRIGSPLHIGDVRSSIERLFATGRYADIQVDAQPYDSGVALTFITRSAWFIGSVSVGGNVSSPPNIGQIENAANLGLGQPFSDSKLKNALSDQQRLLESNGLFRSHVNPFLDWDTNAEYQQVNIRFGVDSGIRAHFTTPVLTGDLKIDAARIVKATKFRRWLIHTWKPMTQTRVRQALDGVRSLYQKEDRLEAKVSLESMRYDPETNSAIPTLHIDAGPRIQINPVGLKLSQSKLRRYVPVFEEHAVDHDLLVEGANNLRDYLQSQGYFEADVEFKEQAVKNDKASIDYLINEGPRHRLVYLEIDGNHYFATPSIRERMFVQPATFLQFPHGRFSESLLRRDRDAIASLYESNGFRDVKVTSRTEDNYRGKPGDIAVFIQIEEGPQYFVGTLQIDGIEHLNRDQIVARLSSVAGQPFSEFNVAVDRDTILAQYFEKGFPRPTFEWSSKPGAEPHRIDLRYLIHEGRQQFVREVLITGNHVTNTQLINRNITLNPGDPLSPTEMTDIQRRLYALGVFARVDAAIQNPDGEGDRKYVLYNMEEARRYSMAVGFGAELGRIGGCQACFDSPAGTTGFSPRVSFDITRGNLWGLTHSISLRTRVSTLDQRALLNYSWPHFHNNDNLTVSFTGLYEQSRDIRTFNFRREEGSAQLTQRLTKATTIFYRYTYRYVTVSDLKITEFLVSPLSQPVRVGIAQLNIVQDRRDDALEPHKGIYNTIDLGLAERIFGSQRNFLRFLARNATYHQLSKRLVLARSTEFGDIYAFRFSGNPLDAIPLAERFFGGGGTSHRGFPENQAGPRDTSTGFPLGGTALLFNQTELRFPLIGENIGGVLFHDMGNVYTSLRDMSFRVKQRDLADFDYSVHTVGFGVRYRTPVGPVRVDLGYDLNPPYFFGWKGTLDQLVIAGVNPCATMPGLCSQQNVSHFQFHFSLGQTF
jgi:outer membrane protein insertion porin family